jgi:hypothetical protein
MDSVITKSSTKIPEDSPLHKNKCRSSRKPDTLWLADGRAYNVGAILCEDLVVDMGRLDSVELVAKWKLGDESKCLGLSVMDKKSAYTYSDLSLTVT